MIEGTDLTPVIENNAGWKRYKWILFGGAALVLGLLVGWGVLNWFIPYEYHGTYFQSPQRADDFTLVGPGGEEMSLSDFRGQAVLIYFGYTYCPDVCPATLVELAKANEILGKDAAKAQVLMVSIDPARDTPEKLAEYVTHFDPSFIGLTGSNDQIAAAATPLGIFYEKHEGTVASGYLVDHTASVIVIDQDGYLRLIYPFNTPGKDIAEDIRNLVN